MIYSTNSALFYINSFLFMDSVIDVLRQLTLKSTICFDCISAQLLHKIGIDLIKACIIAKQTFTSRFVFKIK